MDNRNGETIGTTGYISTIAIRTINTSGLTTKTRIHVHVQDNRWGKAVAKVCVRGSAMAPSPGHDSFDVTIMDL
jgi:uncharacterized protein (UPF0333 family)